MSFERDDLDRPEQSGEQWTKEPAKVERRFDFDAFLGPESLEDQVTNALDGKDLLDEEAYGQFGPGYIPRRARPGERGRHQAPGPDPEPEEEEEEEFTDGLPTQRFSADGDGFSEEEDEQLPEEDEEDFQQDRRGPSPIREEPPPRPKVVVADPAPRTVYVTPEREYDDNEPKRGGMGKGTKMLIALLITGGVLLAAGALIATVLPDLGLSGPDAEPTPTPTMYLFGGLDPLPPVQAPATNTPAPTDTPAPTAPPVTTFTISVTAGTGGSISPSGSVSVEEGGSASFTITPDAGFELGQLLVDGSNVSVQSAYTFSDVRQDHTLYAVFQPAATVPPPAETATPTPEPPAETEVPATEPPPEITPEPVEPPPLAGEESETIPG